MSFDFFFSLDLGKLNDYSALAILEREVRIVRNEPVHMLLLRYLQRFDLGTKYTDQVKTIQRMMKDSHVQPNVLLVDQTGVGVPVVEMFDDAGLNPVPIVIVGGQAITLKGREHHVPKRDLISAAAVLMQSGRLRASKDLPAAEIFKRELTEFRMKISKTGTDTYEAWRATQHDDLVLAVAMGCWYANRMRSAQEYTRMNEYRKAPKKPSPTRTNM